MNFNSLITVKYLQWFQRNCSSLKVFPVFYWIISSFSINFSKTWKLDICISSFNPALDTAARLVKLDNPVQNWTSGRSNHICNKIINQLRNKIDWYFLFVKNSHWCSSANWPQKNIFQFIFIQLYHRILYFQKIKSN